MYNRLTEALDLLNQELEKQSSRISIVICGAFAIHLQGLNRNQQTQDIDSLKPLPENALALIADIGNKLGLSERWLNDQASDLTLPKDALKRTVPIRKWDHIEAEVLDRKDLIALKAAAFFIRGTYTLKDWEDLVLLGPNKDEMKFAISYMRDHCAPDKSRPKEVHKEFEGVLNELKKLIK